MSEAQLIGRGARYFPFAHPEDEDLPRDRRKFDIDSENPLRILEQLHYHCAHNPRYIDDMKKALRNVGLIDETERKVHLRLKESFKETEFYRTGHLWVNERIRNAREDVGGLADYMPGIAIDVPGFLSGRVIEAGVFDEGARHRYGLRPPGRAELQSGRAWRGHAAFRYGWHALLRIRLPASPFPGPAGPSHFILNDAFLAGVTVTVRGRRERIDSLSHVDRLDIARHALHVIEAAILATKVDFKGTKEFQPKLFQDTIIDRMLKLGVEGERGLAWADSRIPGLDAIDLHAEDWHVFEDSYGTDQEKYLIRFIHGQRDQLRDRFDEFYLVRNEKVVTLYSFETGCAFEPDLALFLRRKGANDVIDYPGVH